MRAIKKIKKKKPFPDKLFTAPEAGACAKISLNNTTKRGSHQKKVTTITITFIQSIEAAREISRKKRKTSTSPEKSFHILSFPHTSPTKKVEGAKGLSKQGFP